VREVLDVEPLAGYPAAIGAWLWAMEAVRRETIRAVEGIDAATLDWQGPDGRDNSIGSLLYHIALVEMSWLYEDLKLLRDLPDRLRPDFPWPMTGEGNLTPVLGVSLTDHLARLAKSRTAFLADLSETSDEDWRRRRRPADVAYEVTPAWAVYHLVEHEAGHLYQIRSIRRRAANRQP
jgi:uncharacterized damage-inducible protein DinB